MPEPVVPDDGVRVAVDCLGSMISVQRRSIEQLQAHCRDQAETIVDLQRRLTEALADPPLDDNKGA